MFLRRHWLTRLAAILLLGWTVADLSVASLCASEAVEQQAPARIASGGLSDPVPFAQPAADDCFCCSHAAQPAPVLPSCFNAVPSGAAPVATVATIVGAFSVLDHPPQA